LHNSQPPGPQPGGFALGLALLPEKVFHLSTDLEDHLMTPKQADKIISSKVPVTVRNAHGETTTVTFSHRNRRVIYTSDGKGAYEYRDLEVVAQ
jgi:hypothetical protein